MWPSYVKVVPWIRWVKGVREVAQWVSFGRVLLCLMFGREWDGTGREEHGAEVDEVGWIAWGG